MRNTVGQGIAFLKSEQQKDGAFLSYSSAVQDVFTKSKVYHTTFPAALILSCLTHFQNDTAREIKAKLTTFLLTQRSQHWSYSYWARESVEQKEKPYPDDLDDTFCALAALTLYDTATLTGADFAQIVSLLTLVEEDEGGPYRTWLVPPGSADHWNDVDIAVNSNVAFFLSLHDIALPKLEQYIEQALTAKNLTSPYYPSPLPIAYFISRWYRGPATESLIDLLRSYPIENLSSLEHALIATALTNVGAPHETIAPHIEAISSQQRDNGSWPAHSFCLDPSLEGKKYYAGSPALSTAFCLEALAKSESIHQKITASEADQNMSAKHMQKRIRIEITGALAEIQPNLGSAVQKRVAQTLHQDTHHQISLLPYFFRDTLGTLSPAIDDQVVAQLGAINVLGWSAYTMYDDFLDGEGQVELLPVANTCLTTLHALAQKIAPSDQGVASLTQRLLGTVEAANLWEVMHTRNVATIPDYGDLKQLAQKSIGHALGPMIELHLLGHSLNSNEMKQLENLFQHYLIARQLNDDMHDWRDDLARGHVNAVAALLLRQLKQPFDVNDQKTVAALEALFWQQAVIDVCDLVTRHINEARHALRQLTVIQKPASIIAFLDSVERVAKKTRHEQQETVAFITAYERRVSTQA